MKTTRRKLFKLLLASPLAAFLPEKLKAKALPGDEVEKWLDDVRKIVGKELQLEDGSFSFKKPDFQ